MRDLTAIEADIAATNAELRTVQDKLKKLERERYNALCARSGVKIGDVVIDDNGVEVLVTDISFVGTETWLSGHWRKGRNGWTTSIRHIYGHWSKPTKHHSP